MINLFHICILSIKRTPLFEAKLAKQILSLIGFGYLLVNFILLGFFLDTVFVEWRPGVAPIDTFGRMFLYLFAVDIVLKYFRKSNKHIDILPYLTVPIKHKRIFTLLFVKELLSKWNFIWVAIFTPFFFKTFYPTHNLATTGLLIFSLYLLCVTTSFFIRYINIAMVQGSILYGLIPLLLAVGIGYIAYYISIASDLLVNIDLIFSQYQLWILTALILLLSALYISFLRCSKRELYAQLSGNNKHMVAFRMSWLEIFGLNGEIIKLCVKEILRSQLKRNILSFALILFLSLMSIQTNVPFLSTLFWAIVPIIIIGAIFGEFTFSAESTFFDKLISTPQKIPFLILLAKYALCVSVAFTTTFLYAIVYFNKTSILYWASIFFFECGVLLFFIFQNAVYNQKRFDIMGPLRKISDSNFYGFLSVLFGCFSLGIVVLIAWLVSETAACYFMLITGMIFTFTSPVWLKNIYNRFLARKYKNMEGFRTII